MGIRQFLGGDRISRRDKLLAIIGETAGQKTINNKESFLGRTRLVKAVFLAQYMDYENERLTLDVDFSNYEFFIYSNGPFSTEVMSDLEYLEDTGKIKETESPSGNRLRLTEKGKAHLDKIKDDMDSDKMDRIKKTSKIISKKNGSDLEEDTLELLDIADEKQDWIGFNVEKIIRGAENLENKEDVFQDSLEEANV